MKLRVKILLITICTSALAQNKQKALVKLK